MDKNKVWEVYDRNYAQNYNQRFLLNDLSKIDADFERETIAQLLNEIGESPRWLDVACGTGYFLSCFPEVERSGLDISPAMLETARQANPNIPLIQGDYRDKRPQWEGKWDLVSCMWLAYGYVESLSELDRVVENFANWTSDRGICFVPFTAPQELATGELHIPYECPNQGENAGIIRFEGVVWTWIDEEMGTQHRNMFAPQLEYMLALFGRYFEKVEIVEYPLVKKGARRKAIVARQKKRKTGKKQAAFNPLKLVRSQEWWLYKIAPLLTIAYAETLLLQLPPTTATLNTLTALLSIASVAAYGYLLNDICDIKTDQKANKPNAAAQLQPWQSLLLCLLFISTGFAAPLLTHLSTIPLALLTANYLLPTLYSVPPLRLKEWGIWGILSDAAGAHLVPTLFVAATVLSQTPDPPRNALIFTGIAAAHAFFVGLRGILLHQLWDRANDRNSGTTTFVTQQQPETVHRWIDRLVFPVELLLLSGVALLLCQSTPALTIFFAVYLLLTTVNIKTAPHLFTPSPPKNQNIIPHDLYEVWLPLALSITLAVQNPQFFIFVALTAILFYPSLKVRTMEMFRVIKAGFTPMPTPTPSTTEAPRPTPTNVAPLTPEMQQLETEGYVVLENFLTPDELENLRELVSSDPLPENAESLSLYTLFSHTDPALRQHHSDRLKAVVNPKLATQLPGYRTAFCTWYSKSPNSFTNATQLYQDPSLTDETETLSYGIWCPLIDVTPENGCLSVIKGSHQLNAQPRPFYSFSPFPYSDDIATLLTEQYLTPISLKAGQAILYDKRLFHGASPNTQDQERVAFTCLIAPENTLTHFAYRESAESETLELYAVEDDFYHRYILGEKPQGDGVTLIKTEPYTYDPLTPEAIAEKIDPLHPEKSTQPETIAQYRQTLQHFQTQAQQHFDQLQSQLHQTQSELHHLKTYLQETQGQAGLFNYYRHRINHQPDNLDLYHQALTLQPENIELRLQLGQTLTQQNRPEEAISTYQTALESHPHWELYLALGQTLEQVKRDTEAITAYEKAIQLNPHHSPIYEQLGDLLAQQNQLSAASQYYRRVLELQQGRNLPKAEDRGQWFDKLTNRAEGGKGEVSKKKDQKPIVTSPT